MWLRFFSACILALTLQSTFQPDDARALRQRYGTPVSESYLVRPGEIPSASYGPNGDDCEIVVSPQRLWNSTLDTKKLDELIEELAPTGERGKIATGGIINGSCPTNDCSGSDYEWEKVSIVRWGSSDQVHYVTIRKHRDGCRGDTAQSLRDRYGEPISETYLVRPGTVATASYGASGHVCEIVVSPQRLWNSTFDSKQLTKLVDEIVPEDQRGKYLMGTFVNAICFPTQDCSGAAGTWENVVIFRNGGTDAEHCARMQWRRVECRPNAEK